jgi:hypothetical protein
VDREDTPCLKHFMAIDHVSFGPITLKARDCIKAFAWSLYTGSLLYKSDHLGFSAIGRQVICNKTEFSYVFAGSRILTSKKSNRSKTLGDVQQSQFLFHASILKLERNNPNLLKHWRGLHVVTKPGLPNIRSSLPGKTLGSPNFKHLTD